MSGKQAGWIYATVPLGAIISPLLAGHAVDQWWATEWVLAACHLIGAVLLLVAARREKFAGLFVVMLVYAFCYAATLPLANSMLFAHVSKAVEPSKVFIWAPIAWALVGFFLTGWRWKFKTEREGRDCLYLAAVLSLAMGIACFYLPHTPPQGTAGDMPLHKILALLRQTDVSVFLAASVVVAGLMQCYFLGTAQFMIERGVAGRYVPAAMAIAQVTQAVVTWCALAALVKPEVLGFKGTLIIGAGSWVVLYLIYVALAPRWLLVVSQSLHGVAYVLFMIVGQMYVDSVAPHDIRGSAQALVIMATTGIGMFLGTQTGGVVMDAFSAGGKFQWRKIWLVPALGTLAGALALLFGFHG
jgi:MFS family permease